MAIDIHQQPKQEHLYDLLAATGPQVATILGAGGAKGGGKSDGARGCALLLGAELGKLYPGITITIVRRVFDDLKKNHIDPILRKYPELLKYYNAGNREINLESFRLVFAYAETEDDVKRKFLGGYESAIIIVDEAQQFTEQELMWMSTAARWTSTVGMPEGLCKFAMLFNPGGKGSEYIKRVFWTKRYNENETPHSYAFIHMFGWDNYEWFRGQVDIEEDEFYAIPGKCVGACVGGNCCRYQMFITQTSEGRKYNAFPESIRLGYLLGSFDKFAGQYYAEVWDERLTVISKAQLHALHAYWFSAWMSGDWGFAHNWPTHWFCIGKLEPSLLAEVLGVQSDWPLDVIIVYREFIPPQRTPEAEVAQMIVDKTPISERKEIVRWVMGSDINKTPRFASHSLLEMIEAVSTPAGLPRIRNANCGRDTRVVNARILWEMLRRTVSMRSASAPQDKPEAKTFPLILFSAECPRTIAAIPALIADEDNPEDVLKIDGEVDDVFDSLKYGTAEWAAVRTLAPVEVRRSEFVGRGPSPQDQYMRQLKFDAEESNRGRRPKRR